METEHFAYLDKKQAMSDFGRLFREMLQGIIELQHARTNLKNEFRMSLTMLRPIENNPLKFSPNVDEALRMLFLNKGGGYLSSNDAIEESVEEIRSHQIAMITGMQAAFSALMLRLDPAHFVKEDKESNVLQAALNSMNKKSNAWDNYIKFYKNNVTESESAFQVLFGEAFSRAYEDQVQRLTVTEK